MKSALAKVILKNAQKLLEKSGLTLEELGQRMGHEPGTARRAVWQLFNKITDPRLSTLEALARALEVDLKDLF